MGPTVYGFTAEGKLNRKDFGINWNAAMETGGVLVSDEVTIHVEVEANPAQ
jgi:polyisoprenoid-binding protein YceI